MLLLEYNVQTKRILTLNFTSGVWAKGAGSVVKNRYFNDKAYHIDQPFIADVRFPSLPLLHSSVDVRGDHALLLPWHVPRGYRIRLHAHLTGRGARTGIDFLIID